MAPEEETATAVNSKLSPASTLGFVEARFLDALARRPFGLKTLNKRLLVLELVAHCMLELASGPPQASGMT